MIPWSVAFIYAGYEHVFEVWADDHEEALQKAWADYYRLHAVKVNRL